MSGFSVDRGGFKTMAASFILAPSLLSADFSRLAEELHFIEANGGQWVHLDVMDGPFLLMCI